QVRKPGQLVIEIQLHSASRPVTLFADNDLGATMRSLAVCLPFEVRLRAFLGFLVLEVVFLSIDEQHHIGVLLNGPGIAQVRELRALVLAAFDLPRELAQGENRNLKLFSYALEFGRDFSNLLYTVIPASSGRAAEQLEVIDNDKVN